MQPLQISSHSLDPSVLTHSARVTSGAFKWNIKTASSPQSTLLDFPGRNPRERASLLEWDLPVSFKARPSHVDWRHSPGCKGSGCLSALEVKIILSLRVCWLPENTPSSFLIEYHHYLKKISDREIIIKIWVLDKLLLKNEQTEPVSSRKTTDIYCQW